VPRIPPDPPRTLLNRVLTALSRRRHGAVRAPRAAVGHDARVARWRTLRTLRSRVDAALGLSDQGVSDRGEVPIAGGLRAAGTAGRLAG